MKHIIHMEADNYPDLRGQIHQLAVDHGLVMGAEGGLIGNAGCVGFDGYAEAAGLIKDQLAEKAKQESEAKAEAAADVAGIAQDRTYWHHAESSCVGIVEKGQPLPEDSGQVDYIDRKTYDKLAKEYAAMEAKAAAEGEKVSDTKAEKKADKAAVKVDLDKARAQVMAYVKENGQVKGKELIESFGAAKLSDVPADKLADLFAAAGGAL